MSKLDRDRRLSHNRTPGLNVDGSTDMRYRRGEGCLLWGIIRIIAEIFAVLLLIVGVTRVSQGDVSFNKFIGIPIAVILVVCIVLLIKSILDGDMFWAILLSVVIILNGWVLYNVIVMPGFMVLNGPSTPEISISQIKNDIGGTSGYRMTNISINGYEDDRWFNAHSNGDVRTYFISFNHAYINNNYEIDFLKVSGTMKYEYNRIIALGKPRGWVSHYGRNVLDLDDSVDIDKLHSTFVTSKDIYDSTVTVSIDKIVYKPGETLNLTMNNIPKEMFEANAWFAVYDIGAPHDKGYDLPFNGGASGGGAWASISLPDTLGTYEVRVYSKEETSAATFLMSIPFIISTDPLW